VWGTGIPKDRDEVNRREVWKCDGSVCDLDTTGEPSIFKIISRSQNIFRIFFCYSLTQDICYSLSKNILARIFFLSKIKKSTLDLSMAVYLQLNKNRRKPKEYKIAEVLSVDG
jgi:hypothetical protein